jgi:hypothetical protein
MMEERYSMFEPKSPRRLSTDYPELKSNLHISELGAKDQKFCWFLGCEVSPIFADYYDKDKKKHEEALDYALEKCYTLTDSKKTSQIKKKMPADLIKGIEAFEKYNVSVRVRSKKMLSKIADNLEKIIDVDVDGPEFLEVDKDGQPTGEVDFDKKAKYVTMAISVSKNITEIISQSESGYSLTLIEEEDEKILTEGGSMVDFYHERDK